MKDSTTINGKAPTHDRPLSIRRDLPAELDRLIRGSFYALIFFLPISIALVGTFAAFAILFFLLKRIYKIRDEKIRGFGIIKALVLPRSSPLGLPMACFMAAVLLSVCLTQNYGLSIKGFFGKILRGVFLYSSFLEAFTNMRQVHNFIFVWITSAFVTAVSGMCQYVNGFDFLRNTKLVHGRVASSLRHANDFGAYIIAVCPLIFSIVTHWSAVRKELTIKARALVGSPGFICAFFLIALTVLLLCLGFTFSRAAWVSFFAAVMLLGFYRKEAWPIIFLLIGGFILLFSPVMTTTRDSSLIADNVKNVPVPPPGTKAVETKTLGQYVQNRLGSGRWGFWEEALTIIHHYPIWGSGLNTYSQMGHRYKITWGGYPHNSYLQLTAELGFFGLATFLWMVGTVFKMAMTGSKRLPSGYARAVLIGTMCGLLAFLCQSFFDTTFYSVQLSVLMWLMFGLIVAVYGMAAKTKNC